VPCASSNPAPDANTPAATLEGGVEAKKRARDTFLDPWRFARSEAAQALLGLILSNLADHMPKDMKRGVKASYRTKWEKAAAAAVCALVLAVIHTPPTGRLVMPRHKERDGIAHRYRTPLGDGRMSTRLQDQLCAAGLAVILPGGGPGLATMVAPTALLADLVNLAGLSSEAFGITEGQELVVLGETAGVGKARRRKDRDYLDTSETKAMRAEVAQFNAHLASAAISYVGPERGVELSKRTLRRCFTVRAQEPPRFDQCGRFFGGFWQSIKKEDRRHIRINGEHLVELDYSAAFTHIAFALIGIETPPSRDLYAIPGLEALGRRQVKAALNTLYFDTHSRRRSWPDDFAGLEWSDLETGEVFEGFPARFTPKLVRAAIVRQYPALDAVLSKGLGLQFMFTESEMMRRLLLALGDLGIPALPLHDAVAVPRSSGPAVASIMSDIAGEVIGRPIPVSTT